MNETPIEYLLTNKITTCHAFIDIAGSVTAGMFLDQAVFWSKRTKHPDNWFYKTQDEWFEEIRLTRREQETARRRLVSLGLIEEKKMGMPAKLYFRVNNTRLREALLEIAEFYDAVVKSGKHYRAPMTENHDFLTVCTNAPSCNPVCTDPPSSVCTDPPSNLYTEEYLTEEYKQKRNNARAKNFENDRTSDQETDPAIASSSEIKGKGSAATVEPAKKRRDPFFDKRQWEVFRETYNENKPHIWPECDRLTQKRIFLLQNFYADYGEDSLTAFKGALEAAKLDKWTNTRAMSFEGFMTQISSLWEKFKTYGATSPQKVEEVARVAHTAQSIAQSVAQSGETRKRRITKL